MPSIMKTVGAMVAGLAALASAMPAPNSRDMKLYELSKRQNAAAQAAGLTDVDILQFALTLEWLEATFYQQGFAMFPPEQFQALGLNQVQINDLLGVGASEAAHVSLLQSAIAQAGVKPVQPCQYAFGFTDAAGMVATAAILEQVGVSAYLGAAPLVTDGGILSTAGSILTMEARHASFVRIGTGAAAAPGAFDTALSPKSVFSLAAPFITSCPEGSNLILTAFPTLTMAGGAQAAAAKPTLGSTLSLQSSAGASGATHCAFTNGNIPGGSRFAAFSEATGCVIPESPDLQGVVYVYLVNQAPLSGVITDAIVVAGPMFVQLE